MEPISTSAAVVAGSGLLSSAFNIGAQGNMNRKNRKWNEEMYARQKADNLEFWNTQNTYNSPEQQMQRLSKAGLNPALVYGNGAVANSASAPDAPHAMPFKADAPSVNLPQIFDSYFNVQSQAQRISNEKQIGNNLAVQNRILEAEATAKQLDNKFFADTLMSRTRGFLGDNEQKYQNAIRTSINTDLLESLSGKKFSIGNGRLNLLDDDADLPNFLKEDFLQGLSGKKLGNQLKRSANEGNIIQNRINSTKSKYTERMMSGKLSDLGAKDWLNMALQLIR